jgi:hypothetical protein
MQVKGLGSADLEAPPIAPAAAFVGLAMAPPPRLRHERKCKSHMDPRNESMKLGATARREGICRWVLE